MLVFVELCSRISESEVRRPIYSGYIPFHSKGFFLFDDSYSALVGCVDESHISKTQSRALVEEIS